ncbi:hypothetical protein Enr8_36570 [Blastopirellula retiformator]|uniref:Uncharacterized protein n=2 Tax=Blastopirellula retiformator TaxID=2527970 RepID=A0A5C5V182_9BACT|nr:hypothetical protein Enr8_36570 [Blastopirellula retiformator]
MRFSRWQVGVVLAVMGLAILCQIYTALQPGRTIGNLEGETTGYAVGWPQPFFHWSVSRNFECEWPGQDANTPALLLFAGDPVITVTETQVDCDLGGLNWMNLLLVAAWWFAVAGTILAVLPLLWLRISIKNLLLLQASIAALVLLRFLFVV